MGYKVELNTMLGFPEGFDVSNLAVGERYTIQKNNERAFPLHLAILMVDLEWNFYGYAVAHHIEVKEGKTEIEFEILTLFNQEEKKLYKQKFLEAAKITGEVT